MRKIVPVLLFILMSTVLLMSCQNKQANSEHVEIKQITIDELKHMLAEPSTDRLYIDVREMDEYEVGHIAEFLNFPLSTFEETIDQLPKEKEIVIICRSGNRSMQAASILVEAGFTNVTNVQGAMLEWDGEVVVGSD